MFLSKIVFVVLVVQLIILEVIMVSAGRALVTTKTSNSKFRFGGIDTFVRVISGAASRNEGLVNKLLQVTPEAPLNRKIVRIPTASSSTRRPSVSELELLSDTEPIRHSRRRPESIALTSSISKRHTRHPPARVPIAGFPEKMFPAITGVANTLARHLSGGQQTATPINGTGLGGRQLSEDNNPDNLPIFGRVLKPYENFNGTSPALECFVCDFDNPNCVDMNSTMDRFNGNGSIQYKVNCRKKYGELARYCGKIKMKNGRVRRDCWLELPGGYSAGCTFGKMEYYGKYFPVEFCLCNNTAAQNAKVPCNTGCRLLTHSPTYFVLFLLMYFLMNDWRHQLKLRL